MRTRNMWAIVTAATLIATACGTGAAPGAGPAAGPAATQPALAGGTVAIRSNADWLSLEPTNSNNNLGYPIVYPTYSQLTFNTSDGKIVGYLAKSWEASAIQVHGGIGFTWDIPLHRYFRHLAAIDKLFAAYARENA